MSLKLEGIISLDGSGFERGLQRAGHHVTDFVKNTAVAAFGFYGVEQAIHHTVETATELVNTAKRMNLTVEQVQLLKEAAKDAGTEIGSLAGGFEKINLARAKALRGDKGALAAFAQLGVSAAQLRSQNAGSLFTGQISNAVKSGNVETLAPALREILGKSFGELIPVLKTDFTGLSDEMNRFGLIMGAEMAVKLKEVGQEFDLLSKILTVRLAPVIISVVEALIEFFGVLRSAGAFWKTVFGHLENLTPENARKEVLTPSGKINFWKAIYEEILGSGAMKPEAAGKSPIESANEVKKEFDDWKAGMLAALAKVTDDIEHPKSIVPTDDATTTTQKRENVPSDSLLRVGNFLGSVGNTISQVDQQKIKIMTEHKNITKNLLESSTRIESKLANFGTQSPIGVPP